MSVYTTVSDSQMQAFLSHYDIGQLQSLQGIAQGITNTNYFVSTDQGRYVLTIFEVLALADLPFYLQLMQHLSRHDVACPEPIARSDGQLAAMLNGKPACLVSCLNGQDVTEPNVTQCFAVGAMLAKMHVAGQNSSLSMSNPRHQVWWTTEAQRLEPLLPAEDAALLQQTISDLAAHPDDDLPHGIIHADLFKDNVLLKGDQVAGFIDFYYACDGSFVYDLAIAINDWARTGEHTLDTALQQAFMAGYQSIRPLTAAELAYLPMAHRAACIRFWVSRLLDAHFPPEGELTYTKDPNVFRNLLQTWPQPAE